MVALSAFVLIKARTRKRPVPRTLTQMFIPWLHAHPVNRLCMGVHANSSPEGEV